METIRVLIVDDDEMVREGLRAMLEVSGPPLAVVGVAEDGDQALAMAQDEVPQVVLMDLRMPGMDGIATTRAFMARMPDCRILVLTTFNEDDLIFGALEAGARGYLLKGIRREELVQAIQAVAYGSILISPPIAQRFLSQRAGQNQANEAHRLLSQRELEILQLLVQGLSNNSIAKQLFLSEGTVKNHISRIYERLGVGDRVQAIIFAREHGLVKEN